MREATPIRDLWERGGPFIGPDRANAYVTVEPAWHLKTDWANTAWVNRRNPVRYFQRSANDQEEVEIPGVKTISIDRSIETDAATSTITVQNVLPESNLGPSTEPGVGIRAASAGQWGFPGGLNYNYNTGYPWGNVANGWETRSGHLEFGPDDGTSGDPGRWVHPHKALMPGALVRTYQGYGGHDLSRSAALAAGNLVLTGVWLVDSVDTADDGILTINSRDMMALLIDQILYPPLVPDGCYPIRFYTLAETEGYGSDGHGDPTVRNMDDLSDIVKCIVLWSGFWLQGAPPEGPNPNNTLPNPAAFPAVFGNIEACGFTPPEPVKEDVFDKKAPIDALNELKAIVGYLVYVDAEGGFNWRTPNWWESGNFLFNGTHTDYVPEIDDKVNMTAYRATSSKKNERSHIIVASSEPTAHLDGTVYADYQAIRTWLRGMCVPAMATLPFTVPFVQFRIMAELIGLHIWFSRRQGSTTCVANPLIDIDDQVQIFSQASTEHYIHYVRGITTNHDLDSGIYEMNLTTHWLGAANDWAIVVSDTGGVRYNTPVPDGHYAVTANTLRQATVGRPGPQTLVNQAIADAQNTSPPVNTPPVVTPPPVTVGPPVTTPVATGGRAGIPVSGALWGANVGRKSSQSGVIQQLTYALEQKLLRSLDAHRNYVSPGQGFNSDNIKAVMLDDAANGRTSILSLRVPTGQTWSSMAGTGLFAAEARRLALYHHPIVVIADHECELPANAKGTPAQYAAMCTAFFTEIRRYAPAVSTSVCFVGYKLSIAHSVTASDMRAYLPANLGLLDIVGVDPYNMHTTGSGGAQDQPADLLDEWVAFTTGGQCTKPLGLFEWGCLGASGIKTAWINALHTYVKAHSNIKSVVAFHNNVGVGAGDPAVDFWVDSDSGSLAAMRAWGADPYFTPVA